MRLAYDGSNCIWEYKGRPCTMVGFEIEIEGKGGEVTAFYVIVDGVEIRANYEDLEYEMRVH